MRRVRTATAMPRRGERKRWRNARGARRLRAGYAPVLGAVAVGVLMHVAVGPPASAAEPGRPPNICLIMTDDQGYGDLGCTGNPVIETPHIDAMAGRSAWMTNFYVSPVCAPTRASLLTGRYNYRTRVIDTWKGRAMMEPAEVTIAEVLRSAGYATGVFGKWHLGDCYPMRPVDQGFDESLVHRGGGLAQPSEPIENARRYTDPVLVHNGRQVQTKGYCTDVYFDAALAFIDQSREAGKPFFVYLPTNCPHSPFHDVPTALYEKYKKKDLSPVLGEGGRDADQVARIYAMIENVDDNVGRVLAKLDALNVTDDTLVIFMVDNGPNGSRYVGNMRGSKCDVHDGGIRSPFFVQWPARMKAGTRNDRIAAHIDVMPTLLEAAGVAIPEKPALDGRSLLPLLEGKDVDWPDRTIVIQSHRGDVPVRYHHFAARSQRWKLLRASGFGRVAPPSDTPFELYDMTADPREENNLAAKQPDVVERMKAAYDAWFDDVSNTRPNNYAPPRIIVGTDHEPVTMLTWQDWRVNDSGGWGRQGRWLLQFAVEQRYDVRVLTQSAFTDARVELRIGEARRMAKVSGPTKSCVFENVSVPPGETDLQVTVISDGKRAAPYHVFLVRK